MCSIDPAARPKRQSIAFRAPPEHTHLRYISDTIPPSFEAIRPRIVCASHAKHSEDRDTCPPESLTLMGALAHRDDILVDKANDITQGCNPPEDLSLERDTVTSTLSSTPLKSDRSQLLCGIVRAQMQYLNRGSQLEAIERSRELSTVRRKEKPTY